jgi:PAS domain S-box-containing protein
LLNDITERKRAEEELRNSEQRYRELFENNPHPMWFYDLETLEFLAVNNAAVRYYGYTREEFLQMTLKDIRPAEDIPILVQDLASFTSQIHINSKRRHKKKDGTITQVEVTSHDISFAGRKARLAMVSDITERLRAEEERDRFFTVSLDMLCLMGFDG